MASAESRVLNTPDNNRLTNGQKNLKLWEKIRCSSGFAPFARRNEKV